MYHTRYAAYDMHLLRNYDPMLRLKHGTPAVCFETSAGTCLLGESDRMIEPTWFNESMSAKNEDRSFRIQDPGRYSS